MSSGRLPQEGNADLGRSERPKEDHRLLGRKSMVIGVLASGFVIANAARQTTPADTVKPIGAGQSATASVVPKAQVVVGPGGDYSNLAGVFIDYPAGNVDIYITATSLALPTVIRATGIKNVSITGRAPFSGTRINCAQGFIAAGGDSDCWAIKNLCIAHVSGSNTHDGIVVENPRRWSISKCTFDGFGGSSIHYRGGLNSEVMFNYISASDSTGAHGLAGIHIENSSTAIDGATTMRTQGNYIGSGKQYGMLIYRSLYGVHQGDTVEYCNVGMRFDLSCGELAVAYTEQIKVTDIELHDSQMTCVGAFRIEPTITWSDMPVDRRYFTRIGSDRIDPGEAIVFGFGNGGSDPEKNASIRWGNGAPDGVQTGVPGSQWNRLDGGVGTTFYVKETGTGSTGWAAK